MCTVPMLRLMKWAGVVNLVKLLEAKMYVVDIFDGLSNDWINDDRATNLITNNYNNSIESIYYWKRKNLAFCA